MPVLWLSLLVIIILMGFHILPIVVVVVATLLCPGHVTWRDRGLMCHAVARYNGAHHRLPSRVILISEAESEELPVCRSEMGQRSDAEH